MSKKLVLDSFALVSLFHKEPGWEKVRAALYEQQRTGTKAFLNWVNWGEFFYIVKRNVKSLHVCVSGKDGLASSPTLTCAAHMSTFNDMSKMIQLRNVPDQLHRKLKASAATADDRSLITSLRKSDAQATDRLLRKWLNVCNIGQKRVQNLLLRKLFEPSETDIDRT